MDAIRVENLTHVYPSGRRGAAPRTAVDGVSFTVPRGEILGLLGPNGGGKTTTFHILATYFPPTSGRALVLGEDVAKNPARVRERLGVVFQNPSVDKKLTVRENLLHQGHLYGLHGNDLDARITALLQRVALSDRAGDAVEVLSGGLRRRVELAKGLLHQPAVLLLDEPSTGLDPGARRDLWDYLSELKGRDGITMVVTTHLMEEAEKCDRVAILHEGKLVAGGTPAALKNEIGGDIISVDAADPEGLAREVALRFSVQARVVDGALRIERDRGHEFIPELVGAFPGVIQSVTLGKPTLEDVFIRKTGHRFWANGGAA
jgi:ABC-2 type transport system ATP-binding protein